MYTNVIQCIPCTLQEEQGEVGVSKALKRHATSNSNFEQHIRTVISEQHSRTMIWISTFGAWRTKDDSKRFFDKNAATELARTRFSSDFASVEPARAAFECIGGFRASPIIWERQAAPE